MGEEDHLLSAQVVVASVSDGAVENALETRLYLIVASSICCCCARLELFRSSQLLFFCLSNLRFPQKEDLLLYCSTHVHDASRRSFRYNHVFAWSQIGGLTH